MYWARCDYVSRVLREWLPAAETARNTQYNGRGGCFWWKSSYNFSQHIYKMYWEPFHNPAPPFPTSSSFHALFYLIYSNEAVQFLAGVDYTILLIIAPVSSLGENWLLWLDFSHSFEHAQSDLYLLLTAIPGGRFPSHGAKWAGRE